MLYVDCTSVSRAGKDCLESSKRKAGRRRNPRRESATEDSGSSLASKFKAPPRSSPSELHLELGHAPLPLQSAVRTKSAPAALPSFTESETRPDVVAPSTPQPGNAASRMEQAESNRHAAVGGGGQAAKNHNVEYGENNLEKTDPSEGGETRAASGSEAGDS